MYIHIHSENLNLLDSLILIVTQVTRILAIHQKGYVGHFVHCKFLPHQNYGDWELQGPCRENLHYLWKRALRITTKTYVYCG